MKYLSVCSGIEAATAAWHSLGWEPLAFSEIEAFPSAVLAHHYPNVPNLGDMTKFREWPDYEPDVLVGGTPCQSFSVAGLRKGLADPRGNLMLTYLAIADRYRPEWVLWENVPGVLSSGGGRDFGALLGGLAELGYGFAYRVLDAQYFGVPQRRRRVFVVGCLGSWQRAAAVLFERASLSGHPAPRREAGQRVAPCLGDCSNGGGANGPGRTVDTAESLIPSVANPLTARRHKGVNTTCDEGQTMIACDVADSLTVGANQTTGFCGDVVAHALRANFDAGEDGTGRGDSHDLEVRQDGTSNALLTPNGGRCGIGVGAVAFTTEQTPKFNDDCALTLTKQSPAGGGQVQSVMQAMQVRRLTPRECERLQGFKDDYTLIPYRNKPAADGPRYKALGNSMAVPVMHWIGKRIAQVAAIPRAQEFAA